ncbi:unnamed protein product [Heligmosomoides polygyrus]|uniref:HTH_48 domain-containing protein n=1 Tax=Heligmosomoides polygyrus TaxID=6339 RepID=A0A183FXB9_HELPZ|nr:unnamed protein product [Heligmosomoides polygyrus]
MNREGGEESAVDDLIDDDGLQLAIKSNSEASMREQAPTLGCTHSTIEPQLHYIGYRKILTKWIPHRMTEAHKQV